MARNIIYLILFSGGFIWMIVDLIRVKHKKFQAEYRELYLQNKVLLAILYLAIAVMNAQEICE